MTVSLPLPPAVKMRWCAVSKASPCGRLAGAVTHAATVQTSTLDGTTILSRNLAGDLRVKITAGTVQAGTGNFDYTFPAHSVTRILLTGTSRWGSTRIAIAAYHRNAPHAPTAQACRRIAESVRVTGGTVREMTYKGFLQALGCPPA